MTTECEAATTKGDLVLAVTGASGAIYAVRLLRQLVAAERRVHLTISPSGAEVLQHELGIRVDLNQFALRDVIPELPQSSNYVQYHHYQDFRAGIASGSFPTAGMVICPCSMGTLASIASGHSSNLIQRAADVHLKERRKLIVVPRETPLGSIQLDNMKRLADAGAILLPAMPGFYHAPACLEDLVDFVVARILDQLAVPHQLFKRWGES
jgi:4-hydroxy-3-polyprenylbenzoate decarboxylase